ncbi:MAG: ABC transporter substrate-binding protein [Pseudomonadales bacterium]
MEAATADLLAVVREGQGYFDADPDRFYVAVASTLDPIVDFKRFARSVMAVYAKRASAEQHERFAKTFRWQLVRTYAKALLEFGNETISVLPAEGKRRRPDRETVKMEVISADGNTYPVEYSMVLYDDGQWRLRNVIINGLNLGLTYRHQFAEAMQDRKNNKDIDRVIDGWSEVPVAAETPSITEYDGGGANAATPEPAPAGTAADPH